MGISEARKAAMKALVAVQGGGDPVGERRAARAAKLERSKEATVEDRLQEWQAARSKDRVKGWSPRHAAEVRRLVDADIIPALGKRLLKETARADWTGLVMTKGKSAPGAASNLYRAISAFTNYAEAAGWIDVALLPRKGAATLAPPPRSRERVLSDAELRAVWLAADREAPKLRAFVRLLILTAAREMEVADMAAGEVDLAASRWTIPAERAKNRTAYTVPLNGLAAAELRAVWPNDQPRADHRLLGRGSSSGFRGFSHLKARIDLAAGVSSWRWHDLRRTARTGMTRLGVPREHAEAAINHISGRSALERTYDRHNYADEVLGALGRWQAHIADLVSGGGIGG